MYCPRCGVLLRESLGDYASLYWCEDCKASEYELHPSAKQLSFQRLKRAVDDKTGDGVECGS